MHVVLDEIAAFVLKGEWERDWHLTEFSAARLGLTVAGRQAVTP